MHSLRIMLAAHASNSKQIYFKGYVLNTEVNLTTIFITKYSSTNLFLKEKEIDHNKDVLYGFYANFPCTKKYEKYATNQLILNHKSNIEIFNLVIHGNTISTTDLKITILIYDYEKFLNSESLCQSDDYFYKLQSLIQKDCNIPLCATNNIANFQIPVWLSSSMFCLHIVNYFNMLSWLVMGLFKSKDKISIKQGNLLLAILVDIVLGCVLLHLFMTLDRADLGNLLLGMFQYLVNLMYSLLKWLMGAPAGFKLNNAFNNMLGKYFSYHVELWWLFLNVTSEKLDVILYIYNYFGYLGVTFQAAIMSDMVCLATFHSYCIYVYAARLFNIQMSGLTALLRLFVGKKYNPLRGGIDSCEYSNQELFVGTVAFTILLLLLPTTLMYYIVFTVFRLLSVLVRYMLGMLIYLIHTLPLYVVALWMKRSSKVAGNILVEIISNEDASPLILRVKLFNKSLQDLVHLSKPPIEVCCGEVVWTTVLSNVITGKHII